MNVRSQIVTGLVLSFAIGSIDALALELSTRRYRLDKEGGMIEVQATHPDDKLTRDAVRQQLQKEVRGVIPNATPDMKKHQKEIKYHYENTARGAKIRITARTLEALSAVQDFLHSQITGISGNKTVTFDFVANTSLVVVPVTVNGSGPYRFLLDTGASDSILSAAVADRLAIPNGIPRTLLTAGGNVPVTLRMLKTLNIGAARLDNISIAVADFELLKLLGVDGILGGDYLRRFKISIDYDNQVVNIEPCCPAPESSRFDA
jgi:predicted aspartyl protease